MSGIERPDCDICHQPYHRHTEICGMGMVCPVAGVTYRAKRPDQSERVSRLEEALKGIAAHKPLETRYGDTPCLRCQHCGYRWEKGKDERHAAYCAFDRARSALNDGGSNG